MQLKMIHKALIGLAFIASIAFIFIPTIASFAENANYIYDGNNRLIRVEYGDGRVVEYVYDEVGNLLQRVTPGPKISVTPSSYDFGSVNVGSTSPPNTFTITNTGTVNLVIGTITDTNPSEFIKQNDNCSGQTVTPSSSCTVRVVFSPMSAGPKTADLSIPSNDPGSPTQVTLSGTGIVQQDTTSPSLSITSHSNGQHVTTPNITLVGMASDSGRGDNGIQQVTVNGIRANNDTATGSETANWSKGVNLNPGANAITVIAYDNSTNHNQTSQSITIYYDVASTLTLLAPNGGEEIPSGSTYVIQWSAPPTAVKFTLRYSINNGATWKLIAKNVTGTSYNWNVPALLNNKNGCLVKVIGFNSSGTKVGEDISDATFTIEVVKLTSPDGGEILQQGTPHTITWHTNGTIRPVANAKLFYTTNGGSTWKAIKTLIGNPGSYNWTVPNMSSSSCKVKVVLKDSSNVTIGSDMSDGVFTIQP